jgi:hypothetical protein
MFTSQKKYLKLIGEMSLKERLISWKPTNTLEGNLKRYIEERALIKVGSSVVRTTSYIIEEDSSHVIVYVSYGGSRLLATRAGRKNDIGGYFHVTQENGDLRVNIKASREYHKARYMVMLFIGLILFVAPGVGVGCVYFFNNWRDHLKIRQIIAPTLVKTFESFDERRLAGKQS